MVVVMVAVFAGTHEGLHVLAPSEPPVVELAGHEVTAIAKDGPSWWAIAGGEEVWRSRGSAGWEQQAAAPEELRLNCLAQSPAGVLVGTSEAHLLRLDSGALHPVASFDAMEGRAKWYTPWGGPPDSRSIAVDPAGTIYVNVHVGGVPRSRDAGRSWNPTIDIDADVHQVITVDGREGLVLVASADGLSRSDDFGGTWATFTDGLHGTYCRSAAVGGPTLFVSASEGHRGRRSALYRRPLEGTGPFEKCQQGLPSFFGSNIDSHCLAAVGSTVAFGTEEGVVYLSSDAGETWTTMATELPAVRCLSLD
jgi:hypothetical protein